MYICPLSVPLNFFAAAYDLTVAAAQSLRLWLVEQTKKFSDILRPGISSAHTSAASASPSPTRNLSVGPTSLELRGRRWTAQTPTLPTNSAFTKKHTKLLSSSITILSKIKFVEIESIFTYWHRFKQQVPSCLHMANCKVHSAPSRVHPQERLENVQQYCGIVTMSGKTCPS